MILFNILKLFGIDVPARIAQVKARLEQRVEIAKDRVRQAAQTAAIVAVLCALAMLAVLSAAGVGLFALYSWAFINYGQFYGLAVVGGVLILIAIILIVSAFIEVKSWSAADHDEYTRERGTAESQALADAVKAAAEATGQPPVAAHSSRQPAHAASSAADLVGPLSVILSRVMKFPTTGNSILDEFLLTLRGSAKGAADEAVDGVVGTVRDGDRTNLVAVLCAAVLVGWLLARYRPGHVVSE
jgi:uncharacterized membrane protein